MSLHYLYTMLLHYTVARPVKICTESAGAETTPLHTRLESAIIFQRRRPSTIHYYLLSIICKGENLCPTNPNLYDTEQKNKR